MLFFILTFIRKIRFKHPCTGFQHIYISPRDSCFHNGLQHGVLPTPKMFYFFSTLPGSAFCLEIRNSVPRSNPARNRESQHVFLPLTLPLISMIFMGGGGLIKSYSSWLFPEPFTQHPGPRGIRRRRHRVLDGIPRRGHDRRSDLQGIYLSGNFGLSPGRFEWKDRGLLSLIWHCYTGFCALASGVWLFFARTS